MNDIEFAKKLDKFLGAKFALGDLSMGWDCLNSLADIFDSPAIKFPREFGDWNEKNYAEKWQKNMDFKILKEFLFSLGEPIDLNRIMPGDIIILERDKFVSAGFYLGSGNFQVVSNPHGVLRMPLRFFLKFVIGVRRLIK